MFYRILYSESVTFGSELTERSFPMKKSTAWAPKIDTYFCSKWHISPYEHMPFLNEHLTSQAKFLDFFPEIALGNGPKNSRIWVKPSVQF